MNRRPFRIALLWSSGWLALCPAAMDTTAVLSEGPPAPGLLFYLSGEKGTTADFSAAGTPEPNFVSEVTSIPDGARGAALRCGGTQRLAYRAPGNIYAQRGTLSFFWRSREPVGPTEFPVFRVGYADHSSWDMVWLRIDYNGHGFDAFVTDASLARTRVSAALQPFPKPDEWLHLALSWDETRGIRLYVNGRLVARNETQAVYDAGLDQFGPHSRIISPYQVQSDYNFVRGGDIDEIRIYDRMLIDESIAELARGGAPADLPPLFVRNLADPRWRDEWWLRYGWNRPRDPPPYLAGSQVRVRKVEIHDAYDLKRWWWKASDGIRETTWPGVYNRSRLPGRKDYFILPDWDCYSLSGKAVTFTLPDEPCNHLEISGAAWGRVVLLSPDRAKGSEIESLLFERPKGQEKTVHRLAASITGRKIRFENAEQETPIGELAALHVAAGREPAGVARLSYRLASVRTDDSSLEPLVRYIKGRHPVDERATLVAQPAHTAVGPQVPEPPGNLPLVHVLIPAGSASDGNRLDSINAGLDGIAIDLPPLKVRPTHGELFALNIQVKDPLWPGRNMLDFTFSVQPGEAKTLWLDLRDRILPAGKALYLTMAGAGGDFGSHALAGTALRLVFKTREEAHAEHEIDRFTQARDSHAMLVEEHPSDRRLNLLVRFETDIGDLLRVNPTHYPGRNYLASYNAESPRPVFRQPEPPPGVPLWAFRQVTALGYVGRLVNWYIDNRQIENGELGGGLSDDTDLTNLWPGAAFMGCDPEKLAGSLRRVLEACYRQGMFTNGLPTIQTDELHSFEEGINALGQNLILDYGSPKQLERAMATARGVEGITGINAAGHRHIRSSYYSGTKMAEEGVWGWSKFYSYLVLQPGMLLVEYNGCPAARQVLLELADGLLAHRRKDVGGRYVLPSAIHFRSDREGTATRGILPWPLFWTAWKWTGERKYLDPLLDGGPAALSSLNPNALDILDLRKDWGGYLAGDQLSGRSRAAAGWRSSPSAEAHLAWQVTGDKRFLEGLYGSQIENAALVEYINTEGSIWIDRVFVPHAELQRARLGGIALIRNGTFPGHVVSWRFHEPATERSVAVAIPDARPTGFKIIAYNIETSPTRATITGWNVDPGVWEIVQGVDANGDDTAGGKVEARAVEFERGRSIEVTLAPRSTTVLTLKLRARGRPYWERPDLGIDPEDVTVRGGEVRVRAHSLGSIAAPAATVSLRDRAGRIIATAELPSLPAPLDLLPKTAEVNLRLPAGVELAGGSVELDPDRRLLEITTRNNRVQLEETRRSP